MPYVVRYKAWKEINFYKLINPLQRSKIFYNATSACSENPKEILSIRVINRGEIEIKFDSKKDLQQGREANALWLFSHDLVRNQGFGRYLNERGKLFRSA